MKRYPSYERNVYAANSIRKDMHMSKNLTKYILKHFIIFPGIHL